MRALRLLGKIGRRAFWTIFTRHDFNGPVGCGGFKSRYVIPKIRSGNGGSKVESTPTPVSNPTGPADNLDAALQALVEQHLINA